MKGNVDLTLNRVFGRLWSASPGFLWKDIRYFPWESKRRRLFSSNDLNKNKVELFFTGSREDRKRKIFNAKYEDYKVELFFTGSREDRKRKIFNAKYEKMYKERCDCCGVFINKYPWNSIETLCKNCNEDLQMRVSEYPWDK